jgi:rod shape-determining protein MreC
MALRRKFVQTKFFRAIIIFGAIGIFVLFGPQWLIAPIRVSVMTVTLPLQKIFSITAFKAGDAWRFFFSIGEIKNENERLEKERLRLLSENAKLADVSQENNELRRQLGLLPRGRFSLKAAEVIGRDVNWLYINQGLLNGIQKGMPVIVNAGVLVGRIAEAFPSNAKVMLISNQESLINSVVIDTDAQGIVKGEYGLGLLLDAVSQADVLKTGDTVVTSGLGGDMPKGLLIGTLQESRFSSDRLFQQAPIAAPVRFDRLRYVFVITNTL